MNEADLTDRGLFDFAGLARSLERVVDEMSAGGDLPVLDRQGIEVTVPLRPEFGDVTSNAALVVAGRSGRRPRDLAEEIGGVGWSATGQRSPSGSRSRGPASSTSSSGPTWYRGALQRMLDAGEATAAASLPRMSAGASTSSS